MTLILVGCNTGSVFQKTYPHEAYGKKLRSAGLDQTTLGQLWFDASEKSLSHPVSIEIPYKQIGFFPSGKPTAIGLRFSAKRGVTLGVALKQRSAPSSIIFADLWQVDNERPVFLMASDTAMSGFEYDVKESGNYILRIQTELLADVEYELSVNVSPSLGYPVAGSSARIGSVWGDARDAGARKHEGIDIFDAKGKPVVAAADGRVTRLGDGGIGGKTVWVRVAGKGLNLYYAHLDQQLVKEGQLVKAGDTLGLMGNTGNARTTPPHLHFGIYTSGGAVDPLPFVDRSKKQAAEPEIKSSVLNQYYRNNTDLKMNSGIMTRNTLVFIVAADVHQLIGTLPNGTLVQLPLKTTQTIDNQLDVRILKDTTSLYAKPLSGSGRQDILLPKTKVAVKGYYQSFAYIRLTDNGNEGWVLQNQLR